MYICSIIIIRVFCFSVFRVFCFSVFRVLSGCCPLVLFLGGGMTSEVNYMNVGSRCSDHDYFYDCVYVYFVVRLSCMCISLLFAFFWFVNVCSHKDLFCFAFICLHVFLLCELSSLGVDIHT